MCGLRPRVRDLLDSLYREYPSGTILVWETDTAPATRDMAVTQVQTPFSAHKLLLDGQQRFTSLSAVIRGTPIKVRNRLRPIDIAFNLDHPEGAPTDIVEVEDDTENMTRLDAEHPLDDEIRRGEFGGLLAWLRTNIHRMGQRLSAEEIIEKATGDGLGTGAFFRYLEAKHLFRAGS
jgi:hypothetical protein